MDESKLVKKLSSGRYSLRQLEGIKAKDLWALKDQGYNLKTVREGKTTYYYIKTMNDDNHFFVSPGSSRMRNVQYVEISDTHGGCKGFDSKGLEWALQEAIDRGFKWVHHSGDIVDGIGVYRGHVNYLKYVREEDQVNAFAEVISKFEGKLKWIVIDGNHDMSWINKGAPSPGKLLSERVKGVYYVPGVGADKIVRADIIIEGVMKRLIHPWSNSGRATYALSYPGQVLLRNIMGNGVEFEIGDRKYHMKALQYGHLHFDMMYTSFGVHVTHPMSFQKPNDFTEGMGKVGPRGLRLTSFKACMGEMYDFQSTPLYVPDNL